MIDPAILPLLDDALSRVRQKYGSRVQSLGDVDLTALSPRIGRPLAVLCHAERLVDHPKPRVSLAKCQRAHAQLLRALAYRAPDPVEAQNFAWGVTWRLCVIAVTLIVYAQHRGLI